MTTNEETHMTRTHTPMRNTITRRLAAISCVAVLGLAAAACGDNSKPGSNIAPTGTTTPAKAAANSGDTTPPTTAAPQSGGAGF
jgi:hypothetical protein